MRIPTSNRLSRTLLALLMAVTLPQAVAQTALLKRELPESYIVRDGDTLWNIAG
jgi:LysM repeat protein